jgi:signal transduction histidine kinase
MKERAELVGGTFEASSVPGGGTAIRVCIPLKGERGGA